jgi:hypothetical protein
LKPIIKQGIRILRPFEYELLRDGAGKLENQTNLDCLLLTGARYIEAQRLQEHKEWLDGIFVHIPAWAQKKLKKIAGKRRPRTQRERWIRLNPLGRNKLPYFFKNTPLPSIQGWSKNLKRWARQVDLDPEGLSAKTSRKTWESWLLFYYPELTMQICLSQGHTTTVSLQHYAGMPFSNQDRKDMSSWVEGWKDEED